MNAKPTIKTLALDSIVKAAYNPRTMTPEAFEGLQDSLKDFGLLDVPVVNVAVDPPRLVSGHQRYDALKADGYTHADCVIVNYNEADEMSANITMNNRHVRGRWDHEKSIKLLERAKKQTASYSPSLERLRAELKKQATRRPKDRVSSKAKKQAAIVGTQSQLGRVYALGDHAVICGDFLSDSVHGLLAEYAPFDVCLTDPPYNVAYALDGETVDIENDKQDAPSWGAFLHTTTARIQSLTDGLAFVFMSNKEVPALHDTWVANGGNFHQWVAWIKDKPTFSISRSLCYSNQHELVMVGSAKGAKASVAKLPYPNFITHPRPIKNEYHPTQKPVEVIEMLLGYLPETSVVLDPFAGGGSTLLACENLGLQCIAVELEPHYVDCIRKRYADLIGKGDEWEQATPDCTP